MLSIYIDFITLAWATVLLLAMPTVVLRERTLEAWLAFQAVVLYLFAQSGWTTSYFSQNLWGASASNMLWFGFNATVFTIITIKLQEKK